MESFFSFACFHSQAAHLHRRVVAIHMRTKSRLQVTSTNTHTAALIYVAQLALVHL